MVEEIRNAMPRLQAIVIRGDRLLLVRHRHKGKEWWCLPGGAQETGESPEEGALRELKEECNVDGVIVKQAAYVLYPPGGEAYTFLVDIGEQAPTLGHDPEISRAKLPPALIDLRWLRLAEVPERDRAYLWSVGLLGVQHFIDEVDSWHDEISYPGHELFNNTGLREQGV